MEKKNNFAFFGTGDFAVKILDILALNNFSPELIIAAPDKPKGRKMILTPPPVKIWALEHKIPYSQPETLTRYSLPVTCLRRQARYDLFIVAEYGKIIPKEILDIPKHGALNVHPSLLPKFRGPSPIQSFILSGSPTQGRGKKEETGVTIILLDEEMDHGPIIAQRELEFSIFNFQFSNYKELEKKLAELGGELLVKAIPDWIAGKIKPIPQNDDKATYTKKITKKDGLLDMSADKAGFKEPAEIIERKIRAFTPWPGAYFFANGKRIIITEAEVDKNGALKIKRVKPEGKKEMNFKDFLRGNRDIADQIPFLLDEKNI